MLKIDYFPLSVFSFRSSAVCRIHVPHDILLSVHFLRCLIPPAIQFLSDTVAGEDASFKTSFTPALPTNTELPSAKLYSRREYEVSINSAIACDSPRP